MMIPHPSNAGCRQDWRDQTQQVWLAELEIHKCLYILKRNHLSLQQMWNYIKSFNLTTYCTHLFLQLDSRKSLSHIPLGSWVVMFGSWTNRASSQELTGRAGSQIELNWILVPGWWCRMRNRSSKFDSKRTEWALVKFSEDCHSCNTCVIRTGCSMHHRLV